MRFKNSTALLSVGFATLTASPALADITADDIWNSYQAIAQTIGADLTATTNRDGNKVEFSGAKLNIPFPVADITIDVLYPNLSFTDNTDGTVSLDLNTPQTYSLVVSKVNEGNFRFDIEFSYDDAELIASGTPDDIKFSYSVNGFSFQAQYLESDGVDELEDTDFSLSGTGKAVKGTSRISQGDLITLTDLSEIAAFSYVMETKDALGVVTKTTDTYGKTTNDLAVNLPTGGMSIMNLAAALQQGLSVAITSVTEDGTTQTTARLDGEEIQFSNVVEGASTIGFSANADAIEMLVEISDLNLDMSANDDIPVDLKAEINRADTNIRIPVSASETPQDFTFGFNISGMKLDEKIWALFDPAEILPRDPVTVSANLTGQTTLFQDLLNITEMMELPEDGIPLELNALSIRDFLISAAGARLSGTGDFAFNNDDLISFDGLPAPSGSADVQISGANDLIDKLIEMGLISDSDAMGARMMMAMFTVPGDGDDTLKSKLEITEDGQILANGQRIK